MGRNQYKVKDDGTIEIQRCFDELPIDPLNHVVAQIIDAIPDDDSISLYDGDGSLSELTHQSESIGEIQVIEPQMQPFKAKMVSWDEDILVYSDNSQEDIDSESDIESLISQADENGK